MNYVNENGFVQQNVDQEQIRIFIESTENINMINLNWGSGERMVFVTHCPPTLNDPHSVNGVRGNEAPICGFQHVHTEELRSGGGNHNHHGKNWYSLLSWSFLDTLIIENQAHIIGRSYSSFLFSDPRDVIKGRRENIRKEAIDVVRTALLSILDLVEYAQEVCGRVITVVWHMPIISLRREDLRAEESWAYVHLKALMYRLIVDLGASRSVVIGDLSVHPQFYLSSGAYAETPEELIAASAVQQKQNLFLLYVAVNNLFYCLYGNGRYYSGGQTLRAGESFISEVLSGEGRDIVDCDHNPVPPPRPLRVGNDIEWGNISVEDLNQWYNILQLLPAKATPLIERLITALENSPEAETMDRIIGEAVRREISILAALLRTRHDYVCQHRCLTLFNAYRRHNSKVMTLESAVFSGISQSGWNNFRRYIIRQSENAIPGIQVVYARE